MSEYQYFEWLTVDRPLTEEEIGEVSHLSSHMDVVTATQAVVTYSFGDFKHDRRKVLQKYFDAMLYTANWGSREMAFRFPTTTIDAEAILAYCIPDRITLTESGKFQLLEIDLSEEEGGDWIEAEGVLRRLVPLREQIIQGDYRALYLAWLKANELDQLADMDDESGPTVPAGLSSLTSGLKTFMKFFEISPHLVKAAAASSDALEPVTAEMLAGAIPRLSRQECDDFLLRVLQNETQIGSALQKRLIQLAGFKKPSAQRRSPSLAALSEAANRYEEDAHRRERAEAERKRIQELDELAKREETTWPLIERLIEQKQAKSYDEAVGLLVQLRDLAVYQRRLPSFESRISILLSRYGGRPALMQRLRQAGLVK